MSDKQGGSAMCVRIFGIIVYQMRNDKTTQKLKDFSKKIVYGQEDRLQRK